MCRKKSVPFLPGGHSKMYTPGTIANSQTQRVPTKIKKMVLLPKYIYKNFSGTSDTIRHLKTFRVFFNAMLVLLLILSWCYFSCLKVYSDKFFNACFYEPMFFKIFVPKRDLGMGIIQQFNLGVTSQVSITLWCEFCSWDDWGGLQAPDNSVSLTWLQRPVLNSRLLYQATLPYVKFSDCCHSIHEFG